MPPVITLDPMKPLIIRLAVGLTTLTIGIALSSIIRSHSSQLTPQPATVRVVDQTPVKPPLPPKEWAPPEYMTDLSIVVELGETPPSFAVKHIKLDRERKATLHLDLAESIDGQQVKLHFTDSPASYRILQRYRTSMTISAEGPHLDLLDWRHFDSPWTPLESLGANRFQTLSSEQMDHSKFPKTTKAEIIKEVRRRVGRDWPELVELVGSCNGPNDGACIVTISSIYLRIQKLVDHRWIDVGTVEVTMPMGC